MFEEDVFYDSDIYNEEEYYETRHSFEDVIQKIEQDSHELTELHVGDLPGGFAMNEVFRYEAGYVSLIDSRYSNPLGAAIGNNTQIKTLRIKGGYELDSLNVTDAFFNGLKQNSSINKVILECGNDDGVFDAILKAYQENSNHLSYLKIMIANPQDEGRSTITTTIRRCTSLKTIAISGCGISDEQLLPMVNEVREHNSLEELCLNGNRIGEQLLPIVEALRGNQLLKILDLSQNRIRNAGCAALATLLGDPNCNLHTLNLFNNRIRNDGTTIIINSLSNNTKLRDLRLPRFNSNIRDQFCQLLCNTSSISTIYESNHSLNKLAFLRFEITPPLSNTLLLNGCTDKRYVAIIKVLKHLPNIDMKPLFELDAKEGEQNLKGLPYAIAWLERAREVAGDGRSYEFDKRKLSAIYQFAQAMPVLFVPSSHTKADDNKKRKRDNVQDDIE